jgi:hypothetical protein
VQSRRCETTLVTDFELCVNVSTRSWTAGSHDTHPALAVNIWCVCVCGSMHTSGTACVTSPRARMPSRSIGSAVHMVRRFDIHSLPACRPSAFALQSPSASYLRITPAAAAWPLERASRPQTDRSHGVVVWEEEDASGDAERAPEGAQEVCQVRVCCVCEQHKILITSECVGPKRHT